MKELISNEKINERLKELGTKISNDYKNKEFTMVVVLKGAFITAANLALNINGNMNIEFTRVSSYKNATESSGNIEVKLDIAKDLTGKNILIVEDIIDSGRTLKYLKEEYLNRNANDVKIMTLLDKPSRRVVDVDVDYVGFTIEDKFVVGYGLDNCDKLRELPYIGYIEQ
jgi:hypoxanthine phosphoribosyltransferase